MNPSNPLLAAIEEWSEVALQKDWVGNWSTAAIFPCELVYFLAHCQVSGVKRIIESGRLFGFSTAALCAYAERQDASVVSIDLGTNQKANKACERQFAGDTRLKILKGDSGQLLGPLLAGDRSTNTAVLIDGPKLFFGLGLLWASTSFSNVSVVAMHNLNPDSRQRAVFERLAGTEAFYEQQLSMTPGSRWTQLRELEIATCDGIQPGRMVHQSSLGLIDLDKKGRWKYFTHLGPPFRGHQPLLYTIKWRLVSGGNRYEA